MRDLRPLLDKLLPDLVDFRRDLHQHPECSYREERTAARVLECLEEIPDIELRTGVAGTGIVATLAGDKAGPCVALRADMDALPIEEQSDVPHRSQVAVPCTPAGTTGIRPAWLELRKCSPHVSTNCRDP